MKNCLALAILLSIGYCSFAQTSIPKKEVPNDVIKSYLSQNSKGAQDSIWTKETISIYKVYFIDDGKRYEAHYFGDGRWIKTFTEISQIELLPNITSQIIDLYPGYKIKKAYVELNNDGKLYAIDLLKGDNAMTIYFTSSGKFFK